MDLGKTLIPLEPLDWPMEVPRVSPAMRRTEPPHPVTFEEAANRLASQLELRGAVNLRITADFEREQEDPGVAVWFQENGSEIGAACDRHRSIRANLSAIVGLLKGNDGIVLPFSEIGYVFADPGPGEHRPLLHGYDAAEHGPEATEHKAEAARP